MCGTVALPFSSISMDSAVRFLSQHKYEQRHVSYEPWKFMKMSWGKIRLSGTEKHISGSQDDRRLDKIHTKKSQ